MYVHQGDQTLSRHGHPYLRKSESGDLIGIERIDLKEVHIHSFWAPILEGIWLRRVHKKYVRNT
jgi:hypothetical protein